MTPPPPRLVKKQTPGDLARLEGHDEVANLLMRFAALAKDAYPQPSPSPSPSP